MGKRHALRIHSPARGCLCQPIAAGYAALSITAGIPFGLAASILAPGAPKVCVTLEISSPEELTTVLTGTGAPGSRGRAREARIPCERQIRPENAEATGPAQVSVNGARRDSLSAAGIVGAGVLAVLAAY